jgi:hypothetical protein
MVASEHSTSIKPVHAWLREVKVAYYPNYQSPEIEVFSKGLLDCFRRRGHQVIDSLQEGPDVVLTTAQFGVPINWRDSLLLTGRRRFKWEFTPVVYTLIHTSRSELEKVLGVLKDALASEKPGPSDYQFPGLANFAYHTLHEQGRRGGPMLSLVRLLQSQSMCIRIILAVGGETPEEAYTFDLVGAHPRTRAVNLDAFYDDLVLRVLTAASTREVTDHLVVEQPVSHELWERLSTPKAMQRAGREFGKRSFFTEMVSVANLVNVPAVHDAVSSQYSEGCFATWDPQLNALIATVTGSARPVEKDNLTKDELAVLVGVREDGLGALVRQVEGKRNDPPSSEAVEMVAMDEPLPMVKLGPEVGLDKDYVVPVSRSKLHGHRGVGAFHTDYVEHVPLDDPYYYYPVSCSTEAQSLAIKTAFSRSKSLNNPEDQRMVVFTVISGHGLVLVEKWNPDKQPFQLFWEYMDSGLIEIENYIPQGYFEYIQREDGKMRLHEPE